MLVFGDQRQLRQVVTNLIANAIKFTPAGGHISVRACAVDHRCEVAVEDDGEGIQVGVESAPRRGNRFWFRLAPIGAPSSRAVEATAAS